MLIILQQKEFWIKTRKSKSFLVNLFVSFFHSTAPLHFTAFQHVPSTDVSGPCPVEVPQWTCYGLHFSIFALLGEERGEV